MISWGYMTEALIPVSGFPLSELNICRLCRDAVPTLPMLGIGGKRLAVGNTEETAAAMAIAALPEAEG